MRFARKHLEVAAKQFMVLMLTKHFTTCPLSINLEGEKGENPSAKLKGMLNLPDPHNSDHQIGIYSVFHSEGLLLCMSEEKSRLVVWNPLTGETRWIKVWERGDCFLLGYYQDKKKRNGKSYKVLSFRFDTKESAIYELNSDSWRILDDVIAPGWSFAYTSQIVSLKGKVYWFVTDEKKRLTASPCLDLILQQRKLDNLCFFPVFVILLKVFVFPSLGKRNFPFLLQRQNTSKIEIWVTNKIDDVTNTVVSWSKVLSLDISRDLDIISDSGSFVLDEEKKVVVCCEKWIDIEEEDKDRGIAMVNIVGEDNKVTQVDFGLLYDSDYASTPTIHNYVPSLVQIDQAGGKRKRGD